MTAPDRHFLEQARRAMVNAYVQHKDNVAVEVRFVLNLEAPEEIQWTGRIKQLDTQLTNDGTHRYPVLVATSRRQREEFGDLTFPMDFGEVLAPPLVMANGKMIEYDGGHRPTPRD
jgi:hypothetical protein